MINKIDYEKLLDKIYKYSVLDIVKRRELVEKKHKVFDYKNISIQECSSSMTKGISIDIDYPYLKSTLNIKSCKSHMCTRCHNRLLDELYKKLLSIGSNLISNNYNCYHIVLQTPTTSDANKDIEVIRKSFKDFSKNLNSNFGLSNLNNINKFSKLEFSMNEKYQWNFHYHLVLFCKKELDENNIKKAKKIWEEIVKSNTKRKYLCNSFSSQKIETLNDMSNLAFYLKKDPTHSIKKLSTSILSGTTKKNISFELIDYAINRYIFENQVDLIQYLKLKKVKLLDAYNKLLEVFQNTKHIRVINYPKLNKVDNKIIISIRKDLENNNLIKTVNKFRNLISVPLNITKPTEYKNSIENSIIPEIRNIIKNKYKNCRSLSKSLFKNISNDIRNFLIYIVKPIAYIDQEYLYNPYLKIDKIKNLNELLMRDIEKILIEEIPELKNNLLNRKVILTNNDSYELSKYIKDITKPTSSIFLSVSFLNGNNSKKIYFHKDLSDKLNPFIKFILHLSQLKTYHEFIESLNDILGSLLNKQDVKKCILNQINVNTPYEFFKKRIGLNELKYLKSLMPRQKQKILKYKSLTSPNIINKPKSLSKYDENKLSKTNTLNNLLSINTTTTFNYKEILGIDNISNTNFKEIL